MYIKLYIFIYYIMYKYIKYINMYVSYIIPKITA